MQIQLVNKLGLKGMQGRIRFTDGNEINRYVRRLSKLGITKNIYECLMIIGLEILFYDNPNYFCKCKRPCELQEELDGLSLQEELEMSIWQFNVASKGVFMHYKSRERFLKEKDKFKGKFYCSFTDSSFDNKTYFFRNHELADKYIEQFSVNGVLEG